jgi:hypothetical protein
MFDQFFLVCTHIGAGCCCESEYLQKCDHQESRLPWVLFLLARAIQAMQSTRHFTRTRTHTHLVSQSVSLLGKERAPSVFCNDEDSSSIPEEQDCDLTRSACITNNKVNSVDELMSASTNIDCENWELLLLV